MKIVAHVGSEEVLVQLSREELAKLTGKTYAIDLVTGGQYSRRDGFDIGTVYGVSEIYWRLRHQEDVSKQLQAARKNLIALADLMACVEPVAEELVKQPVEKGGAA